MAIRRKYARTAFLSTVLTNAGFIMSFIYGRILADTLPPSDMGIVAALSTTTRLILGVSTFGILYTITQKASSMEGKGGAITSRSIMAKGLCVFYAVGLPFSVVLIYFSLLALDLAAWIGLMCLYMILLLFLLSQRTSMNSMVETDKAVVFSGLRQWTQWGMSLGLAFLVFFILGLPAFIGVIYGWVISAGLFVIIGFILIAKHLRDAKIESGLPISTYLTFGLPVFGAYVLRLMGQQIDKIYVMTLMTREELAQYFLVARIAGALNDFASSLTTGLVALLAVLFGISITRMQRAHAAVVRFILVISTPLYIAVAAFSDPVAALLLGPQYPNAGIYLSLLSLAYYFELVITIILIGRRASGATRIVPVIWSSLLALKFTLCFILGGYGLLGVAIAVLFSNVVLATLAYTYLRKEISLGTFWIKMAIPMLIILGLGFIASNLDIILSIAVCLGGVALSLFISLRLRVLTIQDMRIIRSVMSRKTVWLVDYIAKIGGYPLSELENERETHVKD